jgi:hypothetical protein
MGNRNTEQMENFGRIITYGLIGTCFLWLCFVIKTWLQTWLADHGIDQPEDYLKLLGAIIAAWALYKLIKFLIYLYYRSRAAKDIRYVRLLPSIATESDAKKVMQLVSTFGSMTRSWEDKLLKGNPWFRFRIYMDENKEIALYFGYPQDKESGVFDTFRAIYPNCELHPIAHKEFPQAEKGGTGGHFYLIKGRQKGLPLASIADHKESPLGDILNTLRPYAMIDIQFSPDSWKSIQERSEDAVDDLKDKKITKLTPEERNKRKSLNKRVTGREDSFKVRVSLWSGHEYSKSVIRSVSNAIEAVLKSDGAAHFYRWRNPWYHPLLDRNPIPLPIPTTVMSWSGEELANLVHLPAGDHQIYQRPRGLKDPKSRGYIPHLQEDHRSLEEWELSEGVYMGEQVHPINSRKIRVSFEQLTKHFLLTGAPGMGKSSLIIDMLDDFIRNWIKDPNHPGFTLIDPSQETIAVILNRMAYMEKKEGLKIPKERIKYFNLTNRSDYYPALNILHIRKGTDFQTAADDAADVILHTAGSGDNLTEAKRILKSTIQALMMDTVKHSIVAIPEFLRNPDFRYRVIRRIKKKDMYIYREIEGWGDEPIENDAILNRIDPLLRNLTMRRMYAQKDWTFDIRKYMDEGYLIFIDTLGMNSEGMKITVGNLINQYHQTSQKRPKGSRHHFMFIDEAHRAQVPIIAKIIPEDRKFNFGIGLISQMVDQFKGDLLDALNLIGTIVTCAQNGLGAEKIERMTQDHFTKKFITSLPERRAAVFTRTKVDERSEVTSCVVENRPPIVYLPSGREANYLNHEKGIAERYGLRWMKRFMVKGKEVKSKEEIDKLIQKYFDEMDGVLDLQPTPPEDGGNGKKQVKKTPKPLF